MSFGKYTTCPMALLDGGPPKEAGYSRAWRQSRHAHSRAKRGAVGKWRLARPHTHRTTAPPAIVASRLIAFVPCMPTLHKLATFYTDSDSQLFELRVRRNACCVLVHSRKGNLEYTRTRRNGPGSHGGRSRACEFMLCPSTLARNWRIIHVLHRGCVSHVMWLWRGVVSVVCCRRVCVCTCVRVYYATDRHTDLLSFVGDVGRTGIF